MRKVRLIAMKSTYRREPLRVVPISYGNTYITGQGVIPGNPSTEGGLTANQMLGLEPLTEEQRIKYPYVINPNTVYKFNHNYVFDLNNPEDEQLLKFLLLVEPKVAPSLSEFRKGKHTHYIEDNIKEAETVVKNVNIMYEALKHIKEASFERVKDIARYFNYSRKNFSIDVRAASTDEIYGALYKICESEPDEIIRCFTREMQDEMLIVKMIEMGVITQKGSDFYDGQDYLGSSMNATIEFIRKKENVSRLSKWTQFAKQSNPKNISNVNDSKIHDYLITMENAIQEENIEEAKAMNIMLDKMDLLDDYADKFRVLKTRLSELYMKLTKENELEKSKKIDESRNNLRDEYSKLSFKELQEIAGKKKHYPKGEWENLNTTDLVDYLVSKVSAK